MMRIRKLLKDKDKEVVTLQDMYDHLTNNMVADCANLEIHNKKEVNIRLKSNARKLRYMIIEFEARLRDEVTPEVITYLEGKKSTRRS